MKNKIIAIIFVAGTLLGGVIWWQNNQKGVPGDKFSTTKKLSIVVTFYPLEEFARQVGGNLVTVKRLIPTGAEPHDYEPSLENILEAYQADIFLFNGAGLDPWAEKIKPELEKRSVTILQMSEKIPILSETDGADKNIYDPHFWLDPLFAEAMVTAIRDEFILRDPRQKEIYMENATTYLRELEKLDMAYRKGLAQCSLKTIVTSHQAFGYLAKRYNFETLSVSGLSPEAEPSAKHMADLVSLARAQGIRHIFFETLVSPKVAETLANEVGAKTLVFNPLEGLTAAELTAGENYISVMQENLDNLKISLQCQN